MTGIKDSSQKLGKKRSKSEKGDKKLLFSNSWWWIYGLERGYSEDTDMTKYSNLLSFNISFIL